MADCPNCGAALPPTDVSCPACQADVSLWIGRAGQVYGPYSMADLRQAQAEGRLGHDDMVMVGNQGRWQPLPGFLGDMGSKPPPPPVPGPVGAAPPLPTAVPAAPAMGPPKASGSPVGIIVAVVALVFLLFAGMVAAILFPVFARAREKARQSSCLSNLKQIELGLLMYCQDYDDHFPRRSAFPDARQVEQGVVTGTGSTAFDAAQYYPPDNWRMIIYPYIKNNQIFVCPTTGSVYSYQFNDSLYNVEMGQITRAGELVSIFEAGFLDGSAPGPHADGYNVGFTDGHCKWMKSKTGVMTKP